jgi:kynurenine 3-monooxygenase
MSGGILIAGAGLAGSLLAVLLRGLGLPVTLLERRADSRSGPSEAGRSINLALAERGWAGLERAGLRERVLAEAVPMHGRLVHDRRGATDFQPYGLTGREAIYSVHRARLNRTLLEAAVQAGAEVHFEQRVVAVDLEQRRVNTRHEADGRSRSYAFDLLIGADGAGSAVRQAVLTASGGVARLDLLEHGYKELSIPPAADGDYALAPNALHIWPRQDYMMIALPNADRSFTATLFLPNEGPVSFAALSAPGRFAPWFEAEFPDAVPLLPDRIREFHAHPTGTLGTLRCPVWHSADRALLIGDAAHAIVPFHGQGMNCAFEDCVTLSELIERHGPRWHEVLPRFVALRRENAQAIAEMALENYREMRADVADPQFLHKKRIERRLAERHPRRFVPRYTLVSFTRIPYALAYARGRIQDELLQRLAGVGGDGSDQDLSAIDREIEARLAPLDG